jgi:hypothetical protein
MKNNLNHWHLILTFLIGILTTLIITFSLADYDMIVIGSESSVMDKYYNQLGDKTNCTGIEKFYTNTSFRDDSAKVKESYFQNYFMSNRSETTYSLGRLLNFNDLLNKTQGVDCEDLSFMFMCLAKEYNETCEYYTVVATSNYKSHRGIQCLNGHIWQEVY